MNFYVATSWELLWAYIGEFYIEPTSISLDKSSISLTTVWQTEQLTATILPADARQTVTWTSSNTSIATVDNTWLVTCVTPWDATITATTVNGLTATCSVQNWNYPYVPTANTVAYYPLTSVSQLQDMSWHNHTLVNKNNLVSFWTNYWVSCAYFPWNSANYLFVDNPTYLPSWNAARTMSIWGYFVGSTNVDSLMMFWGQWSTRQLCWLFVYQWWVYFAWYSADTSRYTFSKNVWHLVTMTYDWSTVRLYLDGSLQGSIGTTLSTTTPLFWIWWHWSTHYWYWWLSDAIVENKVRTATEITNYYNATKSIYGK